MAGSKSLPKEMADHLKTELEQLIADRFTGADGQKWSQTKIGDALGLSQTQVSDMLNGSNAGMTALLAISKASGKSINALLGPTAPQPVEYDADAARIVAATERLAVAFRTAGLSFGPKSPIGAALQELRELLTASSYAGKVPTIVVPRHGASVNKPARIVTETDLPKPRREKPRKAG